MRKVSEIDKFMFLNSMSDHCNDSKGAIEWDKVLQKGDKVAVN